MVIQLDGSAEELAAGGGEPPSSGMWDFSDEMADMEAFDDSAHGGTELG